MTDNCKPTFTINDKLPPMTKKVDFENVAEKKHQRLKKQMKGRKRKRNRNDVKWKVVRRNYQLQLMIVGVKKDFVIYIQAPKVITAHLITKPFIEKTWRIKVD